MRPGVTSMIRALPCALSVITPAWLPVKDRASWPRLPIAIASSAIEMRSPAVSSMSSSRPAGSGETCWARSISSSVVSPIAETTTTTSLPACLASTIRWATRLMPSASATEEPPYFCTTRPTDLPRSLLVGPTQAGSTTVRSLPSGRRRGPDTATDGGHPAATPEDFPFTSPVTRAAGSRICGLQHARRRPRPGPARSRTRASSRSCATTDCSARSTALASLPQVET